MKTNQDYKNAALAALKGKWTPSVIATLVLVAIMSVVMILAIIADVSANPDSDLMSPGAFLVMYGFLFLIYYPLSMVGYYNAYKSLFRNGDDKVTSNMFSYTFKGYPKALGLSILYMLFVFLWALLLYIPGIIKGLAYSMSPFILKDNPELSANQAINLSMKMMKGHKFDLFWLNLSFVGWFFLCIFTLGIGFVWFLPYVQTANAAFYQDVRKAYMMENNL